MTRPVDPSRMLRVRRAGAALAALCALAAATACGDSTLSTGTPASARDSRAVAKARVAIAQHTAIPHFRAPGPAINGRRLAGHHVLVVPSDLVADELSGIVKGIEQAGEVAGLHVRVFNPNSSVSAMQQGIAQGIQQRVDAIVVVGIDPGVIGSSLAAARRAGIPVIATENSEPSSGPGQGAGPGFAANAEPPDRRFGYLVAQTAIAQTGGHVRAAVLTFNNPIARAAVDGMRAGMAQCGDCRIVATQDIEPEVWPTDITWQTESLIRSKPGLNYLFTAADTQGIFATSGIRQAASAGKVHVLGVDGSGPATLALVRDGSVMQADPGSSPQWLGWAALDQAMRVMLHARLADPTIPYRYLGPRELARSTPSDLDTVYGTEYVSGYERLWGLR